MLAFGEAVCGVRRPKLLLGQIADGMRQALAEAASDPRIAPALLAKMREAWAPGLAYAV